jgi:hypothetical protein
METIDRRAAIQAILRTATIGTVALALMPSAVEAVPLALEKRLAERADSYLEEAQLVVVNPRRRRRWTCWWRRGRRVCGWRWR